MIALKINNKENINLILSLLKLFLINPEHDLNHVIIDNDLMYFDLDSFHEKITLNEIQDLLAWNQIASYQIFINEMEYLFTNKLSFIKEIY